MSTTGGLESSGSAPLVECHALDAGYGRLRIVREFEFSAEPGTVVAILGPNGAGKTTLLSTMAGLLPRLGGEVRVDGRVLPNGKPAHASRAGLVMVADDRALFSNLTVRENLKAAAPRRSTAPEQALEMFPGLANRVDVDAGSLSGGEQQMLAVARALVQGPRVLLIDEMSMGLAPVVVENLMPIVRRIADETNAVVVMVEQHVGLALQVADRAIVLVHGVVALAGSAEALRKDPDRLEAAYLGEVTHVAS